MKDQVVQGWPFRVDGSGLVTVGKAESGPHKRFTFWLTRYPNDWSDPAACVRTEIEDRNSEVRLRKIGRPTLRFGPQWEGALCRIFEHP